ncbi:glycosyltransferase family 29 protein [Escherichia coli]|uniref:glycosyltransferase family 29 protein n=2 Tax=Escherichia coli TaxID=562 RepID=UPI002666B5C0|nr:glycosyltransferase family 29 protein [Escherichia coli]
MASAYHLLLENGIDAQIIRNDERLSPKQLEDKINSIATENDIVELPDAWGLYHNETHTKFKRHVRLHAPSKLLQELNKVTINLNRYQRELDSAIKADYISSPSLKNYQAYGFSLPNVAIFPNPIPFMYQEVTCKDIDVIFVGRLDLVKGSDYLSKLISHFPNNINIKIIGINITEKDYVNLINSKCNVEFLGWVDNETKLELLKKSKVCIIPSRFESFSLVAAEAISCSCHVVAWDVGGVSECYPAELLTLIHYQDLITFSAAVIDKLSQLPPNRKIVEEFILENNRKYISNIINIINGNNSLCISKNIKNNLYTASDTSIKLAYKNAASNYLDNKLDVFGLSMMNEHSQEMWGGLLSSVINNYHFVSRKELNYNTKFSRKFPISPKNYTFYDWRFNLRKLSEDFLASNPNMLFIFNGNTKFFNNALDELYSLRSIPTVYSELGWLPQNGNIYFDYMGANYKSSIRFKSLEELTHNYTIDNNETILTSYSKKVILALQLPGDTTLDKESYPLQLSHQELIYHIRTSLPKDIHIVIRKHPRDKNNYSIEKLDNISFDNEEKLSNSLSDSLALIAVNSTVIIEAMQYPVNIYSLGYGIFQNKGIVVECHDGNIKERWLSNIHIPKKRRDIFLEYLKIRQLPVSDIYDKGHWDGFEISLYPLIEAIMNPPTQRKKQLPSQEQQPPMNYIKTTPPHIPNKKILKLIKSPKKFAQDMLLKKNKKNEIILRLNKNFNNWLFSDTIRPLIAKRKFGSELDNAYKRVKPIGKYTPTLSYLYYRTKWIYFGINKEMVKFAKSPITANLTIDQQFDLSSILAESGNYQDAIILAKKCIAKSPSIFRKKQYLRLANIISNDENYISSLDFDEGEYIRELARCYNFVENSKDIIVSLLKKNKDNIKIIGNSPNQRGIKKGKEINKCNIVIRFNSYDTSLNRRADIGVKTDIWVKSPSFEEVSRKSLAGLKAVIITGTNHIDRSPSAFDFFYDFYKSNIPTTCIPFDIYQSLCKKISSPPSGGVQVLSWIKEINGKLANDDVLGFSLNKNDALKGPNGEKNQKIKYSHNWDKEILIIKNDCLR